MWFAMMTSDVPGSLHRRMSARGKHQARLKALDAAGRLRLTGPYPAPESEFGAGRAGFVGELIIAGFDDWKAARAWCDDDPYWEAGVYAAVDIRPFLPSVSAAGDD